MAELTHLAPRLRNALTAARHLDRERIDEATRRFGVTGVHGEAEVGITSLIDSMVRDSGQPWIGVDLAAATSPQDIASMIARGLARCMLDEQEFSLLHAPQQLWPTSAHRAFLAFAEPVGERVARCALGEAADDAVSVTEALDALARVYEQAAVPPILWIDHLQAPSLTPRHPVDVDKLLWNVRALQQQMELPVIVSGHQLSAPLAFGPSAAFHGDGTAVTITRSGADVWHDAASVSKQDAPTRAWVTEMLELTQAHPPTMLLALALRAELPQHASSPIELWRLMLTLDDGHTARIVQSARSAHRLGGRVLEQIARGAGPYTEAEGTSIRDIHRAVRRLHETGLITQPRQRTWIVTNPLVAGRLRGTLPRSISDAIGPAA